MRRCMRSGVFAHAWGAVGAGARAERYAAFREVTEEVVDSTDTRRRPDRWWRVDRKNVGLAEQDIPERLLTGGVADLGLVGLDAIRDGDVSEPAAVVDQDPGKLIERVRAIQTMQPRVRLAKHAKTGEAVGVRSRRACSSIVDDENRYKNSWQGRNKSAAIIHPRPAWTSPTVEIVALWPGASKIRCSQPTGCSSRPLPRNRTSGGSCQGCTSSPP